MFSVTFIHSSGRELWRSRMWSVPRLHELVCTADRRLYRILNSRSRGMAVVCTVA